MNRQYLDPAFFGRYPEEMKEIFGDAWPDWPQADFDLIRQSIDFLGLNYYTRSVNRHDESAWPVKAAPVRQAHATITETGWEVFPQGLTDTLLWLKNRYGDLPLYVTENGSAFYDPPVAENSPLQDPLRVSYLQKHLKAIHHAIAQGVNLRGYYAWSLLDNLEWSHGFSKRFGLVHVNLQTQERTPKASALYYARVIESGGRVLNDRTP
jgi:beta-glucosidase